MPMRGEGGPNRVLAGCLVAVTAILVLSTTGPVRAEMMEGPDAPDSFCVGDPCPGQTCDAVNARCVGTSRCSRRWASVGGTGLGTSPRKIVLVARFRKAIR